jgi:hypothetical protein
MFLEFNLMTKLSDIQNNFQNYLMHHAETEFAQNVVNDSKIGNIERMQVYYAGYRLRLYEALLEDYSKVCELIGEESFKKIFLLYVDTYPSDHFSVRYFGRHFSTFLSKVDAYKSQGHISEMARFEWLIGETLDAADKQSVETDYLSKLPPDKWGECVFHLHPSVRHNTFCYNTAKLWLNIESNEQRIEAKILDTPQTWMFWRKGLQNLFQSCNFEESLILAGIQQGMSFIEICEECLPYISEEQIPILVGQTIHKWTNQAILTI